MGIYSMTLLNLVIESGRERSVVRGGTHYYYTGWITLYPL